MGGGEPMHEHPYSNRVYGRKPESGEKVWSPRTSNDGGRGGGPMVVLANVVKFRGVIGHLGGSLVIGRGCRGGSVVSVGARGGCSNLLSLVLGFGPTLKVRLLWALDMRTDFESVDE
ncbi:hypothetical protein ACLB2K_035301 [Fragaria x ananassa]